jgi:predicted esterase
VSLASSRRLATIAMLALVPATGACSSADDEPACTPAVDPGVACGSPGVLDRSMCVDGHWRRFREYVPATVDCAAPAPVIVFLHGLGGDHTTGDAARPVADAVGAVLVSPRGVDQGGGLGFGPELIDNSRAFVAAILDTLQREFPTDPKFNVLTGFSNGGVLASYGIYWYNARLAAVGVFASGVAEDITADLRVAPEKIPVVVRIGDTDTFHQPFASRLTANLLDAGWPPARVDSQSFAGGHTWTPDMVRETFDRAKLPPP